MHKLHVSDDMQYEYEKDYPNKGDRLIKVWQQNQKILEIQKDKYGRVQARGLALLEPKNTKFFVSFIRKAELFYKNKH